MTTAALLSADFRHPPWSHQAKEFEISAEMSARALLWQMRTGKTKLVVDTACHLFREGKINCVIVIAPNGVHRNWCAREVPAHCWDSAPYEVHAWQSSVASLTRASMSRSQRVKAADWWCRADDLLTSPALTWYAFNSESITRDDVRKMLAVLVKKRVCMVVFDEATDFRTPGSKRSLMCRALSKRVPYRRILEGTLVTNSPMHAFSQFELLQPGALGFTKYSEFKMRYGVWQPKGDFRGMRLTGYQRLDELRDKIAAWSSCVLRSDCEDLPSVTCSVRRIELTQQQRDLYRDIVERAKLEVEETEVAISGQVSRLLKLQQVVSGFLIDSVGLVHVVPGGNPRLEALVEEAESTTGKNIVWCQFQKDLDVVTARLKAEGRKPVEYHGRISSEDKARNLEAFQTDPKVTDLVGQVQSGGRGIELSAASKIIWYSHTFDAILREQATERATKMGGANISLVDLVAPGIDEYIRNKVTEKVSIANDVAGRGLQQVLKEVSV